MEGQIKSDSILRLLATVIGRYLIGFILLPYYFFIFFTFIYLSTTVFPWQGISDLVIGLFLSPLWLLGYPADVTFHDFTPVFIVVIFWLTIIQLLAALSDKLRPKSRLLQLHTSTRTKNMLFVVVAIVTVVATQLAGNVRDRVELAIFNLIVIAAGFLSFWLSKLIQTLINKGSS